MSSVRPRQRPCDSEYAKLNCTYASNRDLSLVLPVQLFQCAHGCDHTVLGKMIARHALHHFHHEVPQVPEIAGEVVLPKPSMDPVEFSALDFDLPGSLVRIENAWWDHDPAQDLQDVQVPL